MEYIQEPQLPKNKELTEKELEKIKKQIAKDLEKTLEILSKIDDTNNSGDNES